MSRPPEHALPPEVLEAVRGLTARARALALGVRTGSHRSRERGGGSEFAEFKGYSAGDDLRHLDWKVLGRTDRYVVRRYLSDRITDVQVLLDRSGSMGFGTTAGRPASSWGPWPETKWDAARTLALALGFAFLRQGDRVGLTVVGEGSEQVVPPRGGEARLAELALAAATAEPGGSSDLGGALERVALRSRKALLIVVSDLLAEDDSWLDVLGVHVARGREAWVLHVVDPAERDFPYDEPTLFVDLEGAGDLSVNPRELARSYREEFAEFLEDRTRACLDRGIRLLRVDTGEALDEPVRRFLARGRAA